MLPPPRALLSIFFFFVAAHIDDGDWRGGSATTQGVLESQCSTCGASGRVGADARKAAASTAVLGVFPS